ncbi:MAG: hypothetical protein ACI9P7_000516 [Candidatus Azotimanducaceae bacterium]|jgi:hypothetical protein
MVVQWMLKIDELASWGCHADIIVTFECGVFEPCGYWLWEGDTQGCKPWLLRCEQRGVCVHESLNPKGYNIVFRFPLSGHQYGQ